MTTESVVHLILRRLNRRTLRVLIPLEYSREHDLDVGDHVIWAPQDDGSVRLRFVKTRQLAEAKGASQ